jgi:hypothetical protein
MINNECPSCGEEWGGVECITCGFAQGLNCNQYETPDGLIVSCTEEEAYEKGYIAICPTCLFNEITWWEKEDHEMCIECWHRKNKGIDSL